VNLAWNSILAVVTLSARPRGTILLARRQAATCDVSS
jgi:hypothetical protein